MMRNPIGVMTGVGDAQGMHAAVWRWQPPPWREAWGCSLVRHI